MSPELRQMWQDWKIRHNALCDDVVKLWEATMFEMDPNWRDLSEYRKEELAAKARQQIRDEVGELTSLPTYLTRCTKMAVYGCDWGQAGWNKDKLGRCLDHITDNFSPEFKAGKDTPWLIDQANKNLEEEKRLREKKQEQEKDRKSVV